MHYCSQNGLSVFYDGLNPFSGLGGGAPGDAMETVATPAATLANNTAGLFRPDWQTPWLGKLQLLAQLPSTRIVDLLQSIPASTPDGKRHPPPAPKTAYPDGEYPEWLRPSPPPSPPPPPPPSAQCGPGCAFGLFFVLVLVPTIAARTGMISQHTLRRFLQQLPSPLRALLAALFGVDLTSNPLKVSPRARGANPDPEEKASLVPEPEPSKRGKGKKEKGKKKKGKALVAVPEPDGSMTDEDDASEGAETPRIKSSRHVETRSTGQELVCSKPTRKAEKKADREKTEKTGARSEREATAAPAPKAKRRGKEESKAPKPRKGKHGAEQDGEGVDVPLRITCNQFRKFAEEDDEPKQRARRIAPQD